MIQLEEIFQKSNRYKSYRYEYIQGRIEKTDYCLQDVVNFVQEKLDDPEQHFSIGDRLSMLISTKITGHDKVTLKTNPLGYCYYSRTSVPMSKLGYELPRGGLTIVGNTGERTGQIQRGGVLKVKGDTGRNTCAWMRGGMFIAEGKIERISTVRQRGIIIENNKIREMSLGGWDISTMEHIDEFLPEETALEVLEAFVEWEGFKNLERLVKKREIGYRLRLRKLDQELPMMIRGIDGPEERLSVLKALEQEVGTNPVRGLIQLAQRCGVNTEEAVEEYNKKVKGEIKRLRKELL